MLNNLSLKEDAQIFYQNEKNETNDKIKNNERCRFIGSGIIGTGALSALRRSNFLSVILISWLMLIVVCFPVCEAVGYSYTRFVGPVRGPELEIVTDDPQTGSQHLDYIAKPEYEFSYGVEDAEARILHNRNEIRDGDEVKGVYSLVDPDGTLRVVKYTADGVNGFQAEVITNGLSTLHGHHPGASNGQSSSSGSPSSSSSSASASGSGSGSNSGAASGTEGSSTAGSPAPTPYQPSSFRPSLPSFISPAYVYQKQQEELLKKQQLQQQFQQQQQQHLTSPGTVPNQYNPYGPSIPPATNNNVNPNGNPNGIANGNGNGIANGNGNGNENLKNDDKDAQPQYKVRENPKDNGKDDNNDDSNDDDYENNDESHEKKNKKHQDAEEHDDDDHYDDDNHNNNNDDDDDDDHNNNNNDDDDDDDYEDDVEDYDDNKEKKPKKYYSKYRDSTEDY